jgi:hypothetical protein
MQYVYTFREIAGDRAAASSDPDGGNLPGGASAWKRLDKIEVHAMADPTSGVVGIGNAKKILDEVRANGFAIAGPGSMVN